MQTGIISLIGGPVAGDPPAQSADDFAVFGATVINGVHWLTLEPNDTPMAWTGQMRLEIYQTAGCIPPASPNVSLTIPLDGGVVTRTNLGPWPEAPFYDVWRYEATGLDIGLPTGHYFLSVAPIAPDGVGGYSYWAAARGSDPGDTLMGCESVAQGEAYGHFDWTPYWIGDFDLAFQLTTCTVCPGDLTGDSTVDSDDLFQLLGAWGACPGCPADLTGDGNVDSDDLFQLLGAWGEC
jgi:hypothetical protein